MARPLPPLNAVRVFESAARHLSFKAAAEELHVTPPAVSHQIRILEEQLGTALFDRLRRGIRLTDSGAEYYYRVSRALSGIATASIDLTEAKYRRQMTIAVAPNLLTHWLIPRMAAMLQQNPAYDLKIIDTLRQVDFDTEVVDGAIWYGRGQWQSAHLDPLAEEDLCPVCSPAMLKQAGRLRQVADLLNVPLIETDRRPFGWKKILQQHRVSDMPRERSVIFMHATQAIDAAASGVGVAIANRMNVVDLLRDGRLVVPLEFRVKPTPSLYYYLARPRTRSPDPRIDALRNWLKKEMESSTKLAIKLSHAGGD